MSVELSTDHSASSYGAPVFLVDGELVESSDGVKALRALKGWSAAELAEEIGAIKRTVEGWESGRPVPSMALKLMATFLR